MAPRKAKPEQSFDEWLRQHGAEVLAPTNPYEFARFRACGGVHVVYVRKTGAITASGVAREAHEAYSKGRQWSAGIVRPSRNGVGRMRAGIALRDGIDCFYCGRQMPETDMTIEHLVSLDKGGSKHMDNCALAHAWCNHRAANLPLVKKIELREQMRRGEIAMPLGQIGEALARSGYNGVEAPF